MRSLICLYLILYCFLLCTARAPRWHLTTFRSPFPLLLPFFFLFQITFHSTLITGFTLPIIAFIVLRSPSPSLLL
uniref:Putative secreted peptide n=1 Tax=Anopheles braziliensis TaxID=58242 RepID=A0A2M3ZPH9_9DIPT